MLRKTLMGIALGALLVSPALAQTVDELVAKNIQAKGGLEKIKAVKSLKASGKMIMGQGMEAPFVLMSKRPNSMRMEFSFQGLTGWQAFDGKNAWMVMPFMGKKDPEAMPAEETKMIEEQADMDGPLVNWKEKGHKLELVGKEQVEGADAYKLKLTMKGGDVRTIYLDADSHLEIKAEGKRKIRGTEVEGESIFGDYKEVNGMMLAHTIENGAKGSPQRQKMVFEKYEFNTDLSDTLFAMPPNAKPAAPAQAAAGAKAEGAKAADGAAEATKDAAQTAEGAKAEVKKASEKKTTKTKKP